VRQLQPADVDGMGCPARKGAQVGTVKTLSGGQATSDASTNTTAPGEYCWRAEYSGDASYTAASHVDATQECFTVIGGSAIPTLSEWGLRSRWCS
jgi:hypothetical protein